MRLAQLAIVAAVLLAPPPALARAWKGISPGVSKQDDVVRKFGDPTARSKRGERSILAYYGEQALEGTKQAQFHVDAGGTVLEITIFLVTPLDPETIEGTYGKPTQKTFIEDTFQKVWVYPSQGVAVYWSKDGMAEALSFTPSKAGKAPPAGKGAAEGAKAPAGGN